MPLRMLQVSGLVAFVAGHGACAKPQSSTETPAASSPAGPTDGEVAAAKQDARAQTLLRLANDDLARGRFRLAQRRAEDALEDDPQNADAYAVLGAAAWREGNVDASSEAFAAALEIDPKHYGATLGLARNLQARGRHDEAAAMQDTLLADDPTQVDPRVMQMWSYYATADAERGAAVVDAIFEHMPADDPQLPAVQAVAAFFRPLADEGPLCTVQGDEGSMDAGLDHGFAVKYSSAIVGDAFARVVFAEGRDTALIDPELVKTLGLQPLAEFVPLGQEERQSLVLIPSLAFGELTLRQVPALVSSLQPYAQAVGETPGVVLGRQALGALGSFTFDFAANTMTVRRVAPQEAPSEAIALPLLMLSMHVLHVPAVPVRLGDDDETTHLFLGGFERSSVALTRKAFLRSGRWPRELEPLDDAQRGLKMVYLPDVTLGTRDLGGAGGLVMTHEPPDPTLDLILQNTAFELGGYINTRMMAQWSITYALSEGRVYVRL